MAEDDEVDVLGGYNFELLNKSDTFDGTPLVSQNSDLLNCDYTVHPQWLLDKPSTNPALWYNTSELQLDASKQFEFESQSDVPLQNSITDESGWTEKEKDLLNRGIEIFGKSNMNLSQFIGSRTAAEVKYFLKNFYSDVQLSYTSMNDDILFDEICMKEAVIVTENSEFLDAAQIPASSEEIVKDESEPSVLKCKEAKRKKCNSKSRQLHEKSDNLRHYATCPSERSVLKSNSKTAFDRKVAKIKFKSKLNVLKSKNRKIVTSIRGIAPKLINTGYKKAAIAANGNAGIHDLRINTGHGIGVKVCEGEQVVKIIKENEDENSESEIDIEDDEGGCRMSPRRLAPEVLIPKIESNEEKVSVNEHVEPAFKTAETRITANVKKPPDLEGLDEYVVKELQSMEYPQGEISVERDFVSPVEKFLFYEFFEGRAVKTPERYLHIRNHILEKWKALKPKYVRKTFIRNGLKQAGDVNLVGRIHSYLEQVGAINFGCEETNYSRPLLDLTPVASTREKVLPKSCESLPRQRTKKKLPSDGEGGYTLTHDEKGDIVNTTVVNEEPVVKQRTYIKKPSIRLIYCRPFTDEYPQKYLITLDISTLILMDLHAHMHITEVMGLIGGHWSIDSKELAIKRYIPCKNVASSLTHCDMCPISQSRAANQLHYENFDILGWYHSHPTFAPEPSHQDMDTQLSVQQWIGNTVPCIGFILSPFNSHGALIASPFRCMMVDKRDERMVPYKFKVNLLSEGLDVRRLLKMAQEIIEHEAQTQSKSRVDFMKAYFQDNSITHLDKFIYSLKMHLAKCVNVNKMTCDAIIAGLSDICRRALTIRI